MLLFKKSTTPTVPWNIGKLIGQKPPLQLRPVWAMDLFSVVLWAPKTRCTFIISADSFDTPRATERTNPFPECSGYLILA